MRNDFVGSFLLSSAKSMLIIYSFISNRFLVWSHVKYLLHLFCKPILMKIEMKINEISSEVLSMVKSQLSYPSLNLKRILEDN